jgi:hypothetical protein
MCALCECSAILSNLQSHLLSLGNDTPGQLGISVEELLRHQPTLRDDGMDAVTDTIQALLEFDKKPSAIKVVTGSDHLLRRREKKIAKQKLDAASATEESSASTDAATSDSTTTPSAGMGVATDADDVVVGISITDEEIGSAAGPAATSKSRPERPSLEKDDADAGAEEVPLYDFIGNVMRFLEAFFSNATNSENAKSFSSRGGFAMLLGIYSMECLPRDFQQSSAHTAIHNAFRVIVSTGAGDAIHLVADQLTSAVDSDAFRLAVKEVSGGFIGEPTVRLVLRIVSYVGLVSLSIRSLVSMTTWHLC